MSFELPPPPAEDSPSARAGWLLHAKEACHRAGPAFAKLARLFDELHADQVENPSTASTKSATAAVQGLGLYSLIQSLSAMHGQLTQAAKAAAPATAARLLGLASEYERLLDRLADAYEGLRAGDSRPLEALRALLEQRPT